MVIGSCVLLQIKCGLFYGGDRQNCENETVIWEIYQIQYTIQIYGYLLHNHLKQPTKSIHYNIAKQEPTILRESVAQFLNTSNKENEQILP